MRVSAKVSELFGSSLDIAVAMALGHVRPDGGFYAGHHGKLVRYSTEWAHSGNIIESIDGLLVKSWVESSRPETKFEAHIHNHDGDFVAFGNTFLIAVMRVLVISRLGEIIDMPIELTIDNCCQ